MNLGLLVDVLIAVVVIGMTAFGYRSGLLKAGSALLGLVLGLVVAVPLASYVGRQIDEVGLRLGAVVGVIVLLANVGYIGGMLIGERLKLRVRRRVSHGIDRAAGGLLSGVLAVLLVWMLALPLAASPMPGVSAAVRGSVILPVVDGVMPTQARSVYDAIESAIADQGLPDVLGPLQRTDVADVGEPDYGAVQDPEVLATNQSVVKVVGHAPQCSRQINGSGFAYAADRVVTNAHVIAGTSSIEVEVAGERHDATVVYANEGIDVAILRVSTLDVPPLTLDYEPPAAGQDVIVSGFPSGGGHTLVPAKVRATGPISGPTFRNDGTVTRDVVALRGTVVGGNSGGPLLDLDGEVVGLIFAAAVDKPEVGYALSIDQISEALTVGAQSEQKVVTGDCYQ